MQYHSDRRTQNCLAARIEGYGSRGDSFIRYQPGAQTRGDPGV